MTIQGNSGIHGPADQQPQIFEKSPLSKASYKGREVSLKETGSNNNTKKADSVFRFFISNVANFFKGLFNKNNSLVKSAQGKNEAIKKHELKQMAKDGASGEKLEGSSQKTNSTMRAYLSQNFGTKEVSVPPPPDDIPPPPFDGVPPPDDLPPPHDLPPPPPPLDR